MTSNQCIYILSHDALRRGRFDSPSYSKIKLKMNHKHLTKPVVLVMVLNVCYTYFSLLECFVVASDVAP